jgi:hypothetical protein
MTTYQPRTPHSDPIKRPDCSKCGTLTRLFGIEPAKPGFELLSFSDAFTHDSGRSWTVSTRARG